MKTKQTVHHVVEGAMLLFLTLALAPLALGQGALTPPGAPTPTMKTLQQVEPRTPITNLPCVITASGSYYLVTNLIGAPAADGIVVQADHVTIDLRGFALLGGGGGRGIVVSNSHINLRVHGGTIAIWPAQGLLAENASNSQFEQLRISQNGSGGLQAGLGSTIAGCVAERNSGLGFSALERCLIQNCDSSSNSIGFKLQGYGGRISDCVAANNATHGILIQGVICSVNNCTATQNTLDGINVASGCRVDLCVAINNQSNGITAGDGCTVKNCTSNGNSVDGIRVGSTCCWVNGNTVNGNGSAGIRPAGFARIDDNNVYYNSFGIICTLNGTNFVAHNTAHGNIIQDYSIAAGNHYAAVVVNPGAAFVNQTPWSNFSY